LKQRAAPSLVSPGSLSGREKGQCDPLTNLHEQLPHQGLVGLLSDEETRLQNLCGEGKEIVSVAFLEDLAETVQEADELKGSAEMRRARKEGGGGEHSLAVQFEFGSGSLLCPSSEPRTAPAHELCEDRGLHVWSREEGAQTGIPRLAGRTGLGEMLLADGDHVEHELGLMLVTGSGGVEGVGLQGHGAVHGADVEGDEAEHAQPQQHHIARLPVLMVRLVLWQ
jgi:hypothetical protein